MKYDPSDRISVTGRRPLPTANDSEYFDGANALKRDFYVRDTHFDKFQDKTLSDSSYSRVQSMKSNSSQSTRLSVDFGPFRSPDLFVVTEPIFKSPAKKVAYKKVSTEKNLQKNLQQRTREQRTREQRTREQRTREQRTREQRSAQSNEKLIKRISASERMNFRRPRREKLERLFLKVGVYIVLSGVVIFWNPFNWFTSSSLPSQISASHPLVVTVQPGDTLWSIAERIEPNKDPRPLVNLMASELKSPNIVAGEKIVLK